MNIHKIILKNEYSYIKMNIHKIILKNEYSYNIKKNNIKK